MTWRQVGVAIWWGYAGVAAVIVLAFAIWFVGWGPDYTVVHP